MRIQSHHNRVVRLAIGWTLFIGASFGVRWLRANEDDVTAWAFDQRVINEGAVASFGDDLGVVSTILTTSTALLAGVLLAISLSYSLTLPWPRAVFALLAPYLDRLVQPLRGPRDALVSQLERVRTLVERLARQSLQLTGAAVKQALVPLVAAERAVSRAFDAVALLAQGIARTVVAAVLLLMAVALWPLHLTWSLARVTVSMAYRALVMGAHLTIVPLMHGAFTGARFVREVARVVSIAVVTRLLDAGAAIEDHIFVPAVNAVTARLTAYRGRISVALSVAHAAVELRLVTALRRLGNAKAWTRAAVLNPARKVARLLVRSMAFVSSAIVWLALLIAWPLSSLLLACRRAATFVAYLLDLALTGVGVAVISAFRVVCTSARVVVRPFLVIAVTTHGVGRAGAKVCKGATTAALRALMLPLAWLASAVGHLFAMAASASSLGWSGLTAVIATTTAAVRAVVTPLKWLASLLLSPIAMALRTVTRAANDVYVTLAWLARRLLSLPAAALAPAKRTLSFIVRTVLIGISTAPDAWTALQLLVTRKEGIHSMESLNLSRQRVLSLVGTLWLFGILGVAVFSVAAPSSEPTVEIVQWANSHMTRSGLLPDMAKQFNDEGHTTQDGKKIVVKVYSRDSYVQVDDLRARVTRGVPIDSSFPDPTIVTPSADHWLIAGNYAAGRTLVDLNQTRSLAHTWIGIVTDREMAECLGWPQKEIGYADIIALRDDPLGWKRYPCAKAEWGQRPLVAFTDPTTSSTGRSVLYTLYAIASGKPLDQLSAADIKDPAVTGYVRQFQGLVDHYMSGTLPLNTKIYQGPRYGHFFLIPEDNLIHLYEGSESAFINGERVKAPPISRPMVMIYPKEGSTMHNHSASFVEAPWVSPEQREAAKAWVEYLLQTDRQQAFMRAGFRPSTNLALGDPISGRYGLNASQPQRTVNPDRIDQAAAAAIVESWDEVKRPSIVTFVVDTSGSMQGEKLKQAKDGMVRAIDAMAKNNSVGLVTFSNGINTRVPVAPLIDNRFAISDAVLGMTASGETGLYDAIRAGIEMADAAPGRPDATRSVVVLTDGRANRGATSLQDLVTMTSRGETKIRDFRGFEPDLQATDENGRQVAKADVVGAQLNLKTRTPVQVFFIGVGKDADLDIGRILSEATGAEFQGATAKDLANVLEEFSKYF